MGRDTGEAAADDDGRGGGPVHEVDAALAMILEGAARLAAARTWSLSDGELRVKVLEGHAAVAGVGAGRLGLVRDLDARPTAVAGAAPGRTAATFLIHACRVSPGQAHKDVAAAHALHPDTGALPEMGAALAAGEVSRAHVDVAVRTLTRIPVHLTRAVDADGITGGQRVDAFLTQHSRVLAPASTERLARQLLATLDPTGTDRYDPHAYQRRGLTCAIDSTGMLVGRFQLDPAAAAIVKAALDAHAAPTPQTTAENAVGEDGQQVLVGDERTRPQRYADALIAIARHALSAAPSSAGEPAHVLIVATPEQVAAAQRAASADARPSPPGTGDPAGDPAAAGPAGLASCAQTGPLDPATLGRLGCDAILTRVLLAPSGAVLDLGRAVRTASPGQRRALAARDGGCVIPGCTAPPGICEAHHVTWHRHGGPTDITNLALVCPRHHSTIHAGIWTLRMINGIPWARPPTWIDPHRPLLRNTAHRAADQARRLGQQLRLHLHLGPDHDPPGHTGEGPDPPG